MDPAGIGQAAAAPPVAVGVAVGAAPKPSKQSLPVGVRTLVAHGGRSGLGDQIAGFLGAVALAIKSVRAHKTVTHLPW